DPKEVKRFLARVSARFAAIRPALEALDRAVDTASRRLGDDDLACSLAAHRALEQSATIRLALRGWDDLLRPVDAKTDRKSLLQAPVKAVPTLVESLGHREVRVRLAALYALETLTVDAAGATAALVKAL